jgi:hypothetical protein
MGNSSVRFFRHRASNASDSCVSLLPFSWASLVSNEVHWRFTIYVPWHRTGTYLVTTDASCAVHAALVTVH